MTSTTTLLPQRQPSVERRLEKMHLKPVTAIAIVAGLIVLVADSQSLALIPLTSTMEKDYNLSSAQTSIVLAILALVGAGAVPVLTRVAERVSLRLFLNIGLGMATLGNLFCAIATKDDGFLMLMIGRVMLGLSAAAPISMALIREKSMDAKSTNRGVGFVTAMIGVGVAISYLLGGVILHYNGSTSTVFWVMAALSLISLIAGLVLVPDLKIPAAERIDYIGASLLIIGLTGVALSISFSSDWPIGSILGLLVGGLVVLALWVWVELKVKAPLINLRLTFRKTTVAAFFSVGLYSSLAVVSNLAVTTFAQIDPNQLKAGGEQIGQGVGAAPGSSAAIGQAFTANFNAQTYGLTDWGHTVLASSMFLMPTALMLILGGFVINPVIARLGVKTTMIFSGVIVVVCFGFLSVWHDQAWENMLGMLLWGIAFAFGYSASTAAYLHAARDFEAAQFSASGTMVFASVGGMGASVFVAVLAAFPLVHRLTPSFAAIAEKIPAASAIPSADAFTWTWVASGIGGVILLILALIHRNAQYQGGTREIPLSLPTDQVPADQMLPNQVPGDRVPANN